MITTREINVDLTKGKLKLRRVSTKDIDAGVRVEPPKEPIKTRGVSTTTLPDVADIAEKKRRDDIAVEKKLAMRDAKKVAMAEKKVEIITAPAIVKDGEGKLLPTVGANSFGNENLADTGIKEDKEKKPWLEMTDVEKKVVYKERAKRAAATRAAKKKK